MGAGPRGWPEVQEGGASHRRSSWAAVEAVRGWEPGRVRVQGLGTSEPKAREVGGLQREDRPGGAPRMPRQRRPGVHVPTRGWPEQAWRLSTLSAGSDDSFSGPRGRGLTWRHLVAAQPNYRLSLQLKQRESPRPQPWPC